jgi:DNA-binding NarL/FixJ family response regulator
MSNDPRPQPKPKIAQIVIADDHDLARAGLHSMLKGQRGLKVVGEGKNGREALELCRRLQPDLALLDVRMPEMDGLTTCHSIKQEYPAISVILVTIHENPEYLLEALKAGAAGYIFKDTTQRELLTAVRRVLCGESILDKDLVVRVLRHFAEQTSSQQEEFPPEQVSPPEQLSPREREVLELLTQGQTNREIAQHLTVSRSTVKNHVEHILAKLGVSDRTQAAVRAIELGLLHTTS